jgi:hypothetical protein
METVNISPQGFEQARNGLTSAELDKPIDQVVVPETPEPAVAPTAQPEVETVPEATATAEEEEARVPKSRFLTMHSRAVEAEKQLREIKAERAQQTFEPPQISTPTELPSYWIDMFGDSPASVEAFEAEQARLATIEEKAAERAFERLSNREKEEEARTNDIVSSFDQAFEELGIIQDREFTDDEQVAILDIVEQYSPKDTDGMLLRDFLLPLDKAYEIYSVRSDAKTSATRQARNGVAALTGAQSEGSASASNQGQWQPGQWRNKVP